MALDRREMPGGAGEFVANVTGAGWINRRLVGTVLGRGLRCVGLDPDAAGRRRFERRARRALADFLRDGARMALPAPARPAVSVLIVLYNQAHLTLRCLEGLVVQTDRAFETILFDNGSSDETAVLLTALDGARTMGDAENLGFLGGANAAAEVATGDLLLFLNTDAVLHPEAIARARRHFANDPALGALGGRLVMPNGRLQEAGSMVDRAGRAHGLGAGRPADDPDFARGRAVDYCSGAVLFVRRAAFEALDRFDADYAPAYYEETDLCFRLRDAGYAVRYEPDIVALHLISASEPSRGWAAAQIERNRQIFVARHASRLARETSREQRQPDANEHADCSSDRRY